MNAEHDRIIWRRELRLALGVTHETMRRWMKKGLLPKPDVRLTRRATGWKVSTLRNGGIDLF